MGKKKRGKNDLVEAYIDDYEADPAVVKRLRGGRQTRKGLVWTAKSLKDANRQLLKAKREAADELLPGAGELVR